MTWIHLQTVWCPMTTNKTINHLCTTWMLTWNHHLYSAKSKEPLRKERPSGIDNIPIELFQAGGQPAAEAIHLLCTQIWKNGVWRTGAKLFIYQYQKREISNCAKTIAHVSHASKILLINIAERMKTILEIEISEQQAGFRNERGTRDHIFNLRTLMEKVRAHSINLYLCFIDYSKAFDCVVYDQLWLSMQKLGFPDHLIGLIETLYRDQQSTIRTPCGLTDSFHNAKGVRQGCILSPYLLFTNCVHSFKFQTG